MTQPRPGLTVTPEGYVTCIHTIEDWRGYRPSYWAVENEFYVSKWLTLERGQPGPNALKVDQLDELPERKLAELNAQLHRVGEYERERYMLESAA